MKDRGHVTDHLIHPFAVVYVTYRLARRMQVFPKVDGAEGAFLRVFARYAASRPKPPAAADILAQIAARSDVLTIGAFDEAMDVTELKRVPAFITGEQDGTRELWVPTGQKKKVFDWPRFRALLDFHDWYQGTDEKKRAGGKRTIGTWKGCRVVRFKLP